MGAQKYGIDVTRVESYARQIREIADLGIQVGIVIGGGNIFRGLSGTNKGFDRVKGDSMINVGIFDGDLLIVTPQKVANNGDIVVAVIGEEATVKTFYREKGHIRLQPENDAMEPIIVNEVTLAGKVTGLFRTMH